MAKKAGTPRLAGGKVASQMFVDDPTECSARLMGCANFSNTIKIKKIYKMEGNFMKYIDVHFHYGDCGVFDLDNTEEQAIQAMEDNHLDAAFFQPCPGAKDYICLLYTSRCV